MARTHDDGVRAGRRGLAAAQVVPTAVPTNTLEFVGITPCRVLDTRGNGFTGAYGPPLLSAGVPRNFKLAGQCGIPVDAEAVSVNLGVTLTQGAGFILVYPTGGAQPVVSSLNYERSGQTIANAAVIPLGTDGTITVDRGRCVDRVLPGRERLLRAPDRGRQP